MRGWSIRWRLTLSNAAVLAGLFAVFCGVMLYLVHGHLQREEDAWLSEELHELRQDVKLARDREQLQETFDTRYAIHSDVHFRVTAPDAAVIQSRFLRDTALPRPGHLDETEPPRFEDVDLAGLGPFRLLSLTAQDKEGRPLLLQVASAKAEMSEDFRWYLGTVVAAVPIALAVAIAAGYGLACHALAPVEQMVATAERISAERLDERLTIRNPRDELGRLGLTLNAMFDRLHRAIDQMRRFTSDAAHELRSPIAALRTKAEVILRAPREAEVYRRAMEQTADEAARLTELVHQLLTLSRYDAGQFPPLEDRVRVDLLVADVVEQFRGRSTDWRHTLIVQPLPPWLLVGDDILLSQLFFNLLDNATKYTPPGGTIHVRGRQTGRELTVEIEDDGIGIPEQLQGRVFDRFFRVDSSQNDDRSGVGLGLAICRAVIETHRGRIAVRSVPGQGSCFQVTLPGEPATASGDSS